MTITEQREPSPGTEAHDRVQRHGLIRAKVLDSLGRPGGLLAVQVRPLWGDCYRVNVLVGTGPASARVADSFFLVADGAGSVLSSEPELVRKY